MNAHYEHTISVLKVTAGVCTVRGCAAVYGLHSSPVSQRSWLYRDALCYLFLTSLCFLLSSVQFFFFFSSSELLLNVKGLPSHYAIECHYAHRSTCGLNLMMMAWIYWHKMTEYWGPGIHQNLIWLFFPLWCLVLRWNCFVRRNKSPLGVLY